MKKNYNATKKGIFDANVIANKNIGSSFYRISLEFSGQGAMAFFNAEPGQFAELDLSNAGLPKAETIPERLADSAERNILLRRPFSFSDITGDSEKTIVEILYCVVGPASLRMSGLKAGDSLSVIGPLGNGFAMQKNKTTALLVLGGMGAGPIQHLTNVLTEKFKNLKTIVFAGAKTEKDIPFEPANFARKKTELHLTTDDGSAGSKGFVTDRLNQWLSETDIASEDIVIYSCGPEGMLARIAQIAKEKGIDCLVSMECRMACGIGLCQSCAIECKTDDPSETVYKMCCKDGPVFDSKEIVF